MGKNAGGNPSSDNRYFGCTGLPGQERLALYVVSLKICVKISRIETRVKNHVALQLSIAPTINLRLVVKRFSPGPTPEKPSEVS